MSHLIEKQFSCQIAPSDIEVTPNTTSMIVAWIGIPDDQILNYKVTIVPTDGGSPINITVGGDKNSTEIEGLQPNTNYTLTVRAVTPDGEGDPTSIAVITKTGKLIWNHSYSGLYVC